MDDTENIDPKPNGDALAQDNPGFTEDHDDTHSNKSSNKDRNSATGDDNNKDSANLEDVNLDSPTSEKEPDYVTYGNGMMNDHNNHNNEKHAQNGGVSRSYSNDSFDNGELKKTPVVQMDFMDPLTHKIRPVITMEIEDPLAAMKRREEEEQAHRDQEPLRICKWICTYPKAWFAATLAGHLFFILLTVILLLVDYDIFPIVFDDLPLDIRDDVDYKRGLAWDYKLDTTPELIDLGDVDYQLPRTDPMDEVEFIYNMKKDKNILTQENLRLIQECEEKYWKEPTFHSEFCMTEDGKTCVLVNSVIRYFDGSLKHINPVFDDPNFENIVGVFYAANTTVETMRELKYHISSDAVITETEAYMSALRSKMMVGWPLKGFNTSDERQEDQEKVWEDFLEKTYIDLLEKQYDKGLGEMEFVANSEYLLQTFIELQVFTDVKWAIGSMLFIYLFMRFQTGSFWLTSWAIISILTCFFCTNVLYNLILRFEYFGIFHVLAIFIILGIGADDVFVFVDTWRETEHKKYLSLAHRLSDAYRHAGMAMLYTSLTTSLAFLIGATSPFLAVYAFGAFSGVLVIVNYCSVIIFYPGVIITYHLYFEKYKFCCCCPQEKTEVEHNIEHMEKEQEKGMIVRFFGTYYFDFITHKLIRWFILAGYLALFCIMIYFVSTLEVNEEQIKYLKTNCMSGRYLEVEPDEFSALTSGGRAQIYLVWGLEEQSRSECSHSDQECTGHTVWDDNFDMNSYEAQVELVEFCNELMYMEGWERDQLHIQYNHVVGRNEIECYIWDMDMWFKEENMTDNSFPVTANGSQNFMEDHRYIYHTDLPWWFMEKRYYEVGMSEFLFDGFKQLPEGAVRPIQHYKNLIGGARTNETIKSTFGGDYSPDGKDYVFYYGTKLKYAAILVNTTINGFDLGYPDGLPIRDDWEDWMDKKVAAMVKPLQGGWQCTPEDESLGFNLWHWLKTQELLVKSAVQGIIIGLCIAMPILIIATNNWIVGFMATMIILIITISVLGFIPMCGWKLGLLESLNLVLVVGLAVDYVVHLAEGYARSNSTDRKSRTKDMLEEVGISVLSGACTTLGASSFMFGAIIIFFFQFGLFMFSTIGFSLVYALGLFPTLTAMVGPQDDYGSIDPFKNWVKRQCGKCGCKSQSADLNHSTA